MLAVQRGLGWIIAALALAAERSSSLSTFEKRPRPAPTSHPLTPIPALPPPAHQPTPAFLCVCNPTGGGTHARSYALGLLQWLQELRFREIIPPKNGRNGQSCFQKMMMCVLVGSGGSEKGWIITQRNSYNTCFGKKKHGNPLFEGLYIRVTWGPDEQVMTHYKH